MKQDAIKYKSRYRIDSARLSQWDYGANGYYFVTVCVKNKECIFGNVSNGIMLLSEMGKIAEKYWKEIPVHFPFVRIDEYIIMPNHVHGLIVIDKEDGDGRNKSVLSIVETRDHASLQRYNKFGPQSKNLASIIRGYKSGVKKYATLNSIPFHWQPRFYDHIVRDEKSLMNIREYIVNNPLNWDEDEENSEFIKT